MKTAILIFLTFFSLFSVANSVKKTTLPSKSIQQNKSNFLIENFEILGFNSESGQFDQLSKFSEQANPTKILIKFKIISAKNSSESDSYLYKINIIGSGKGRGNEAEGKIDDFNFISEINNFEFGQYLVFLTPFPCNKEVQFKVNILDKNKKNVFAKNNLNCYAN